MRLRLFLSRLVSRPSPSSFLCCLFVVFSTTHARLETRPVISRRPVRVISPAPIQVLGRGGPRGQRVGPLQVSGRVTNTPQTQALCLAQTTCPPDALSQFFLTSSRVWVVLGWLCLVAGAVFCWTWEWPTYGDGEANDAMIAPTAVLWRWWFRVPVVVFVVAFCPLLGSSTLGSWMRK